MEENKLSEIVEPLLNWYAIHARAFPWREGKDPYRIWISEIMLQQTKIEAVKKYYDRFIKELPTVQALANVEDEKILKLWEGLGYYSRARNLKKAAIMVMEQYQGKMPGSYQELITLPGIGEYTAGAIASIAYNEKIPAVDGNVLRVVSRILENEKDVLLPNTKKEMTEKLLTIMPEKAGDFNEAIMELGETICIPNGVPLCTSCPLEKKCLARLHESYDRIPLREKKQKRRKEKRMVLLLMSDGKIAIQKRKESGLLAGLYEFPNIEVNKVESELNKYLEQEKIVPLSIQEIGHYSHIFTHIEWDMTVFEIQIKEKIQNFLWVNKEELFASYPMPTAFSKFYKAIK